MADDSSLTITNDGTSAAAFNLKVNGNALLLSTADIVDAIQATTAYQTEGAAYATWAWMIENSYHWDPFNGENWQHSPYLFLNSMGFGYCDDVARVYASILTEMGYEARVWGIEGHVISEVFENGSWKIFDVDMRVVYLDDQMNPQGYDYVVNSGADFAQNFAGSLYSAIRPDSWAFGSEILDMYRSTGNNFAEPAPSTRAFGGSAALTLPGGATLTIEDAPAGYIESMYGTDVPSLSLLKVSFGDLDGFSFEYPLVPVAITGSGTVVIDGTSYAIGSAALDARLADRNRPIYEITVDSDSGLNEIVYLLNSKRFSLSSETSATIEGGNDDLRLTLSGSDGADTLRDAQILSGGDGNDLLSTAPGTTDRMANGVMDGGNGDDVLEIRASTNGVGIWGNSAFQLLGGAGDDRFLLSGTQIHVTPADAATLDGGAGFDTLVWNGPYNLTVGGAQNAAVGLYAGEYAQAVAARDIEKIDLISAQVTGLNLTFSAQDVAAITAGSDFQQSFLGLGLSGSGNMLFIDAGNNQIDLTGWSSLGRSTVGGIEYDIFQSGSSFLGIAIVSDRALGGTAAAEVLAGFAGNDLITGGGGADTLTGFAGNDTITQTAAITNAAAGTSIDGGSGDDTLIFDGNQAYTSDYVTIAGGDGNDTIRAGTGAGQYVGSIQIDGGTGNDSITVGQIAGSQGDRGYVDGGDGDDLIEVLDTGTGVSILADSVFKLRGGAGDDRFILGGTQIATHPLYTAEVNGGAGFDTLVWNGSYNVTAATKGQNPAVGLYAGLFAQQIQARNIEKIDLAGAGVSGLTVRFSAGDVASITAGSDFDRSLLGFGSSGIGKVLFVDAGDNRVDVTGWAMLGEIQFGGTNYQLLQSGASYLAIDTVANHIVAERSATNGSEALDTVSAGLSLAEGDLGSSLSSMEWSGGAGIPAETVAALTGALSLSRSGDSVSATLALADRLLDFLAAGETLTVTYAVTATDALGAVNSKPVTFTITGSNDAPTLAAGIPDLGVGANVKSGVAAGSTVAALYAPGSTVNLLDGLPPLTTLGNYATSGYNFVGARNWFAANGIDIAALAGGTIIFADGTTGLISRASNGGAANPSEAAYIYYQAYDPGQALLSERAGITGSELLDTASLSLAFTDSDASDSHIASSAMVSAVWSGGSTIPSETAVALASALSLSLGGGSITADFALADRLVDFLAAGETLAITYNVTLTDRAGGSTSKPVTFTFTGSNNSPVLTADIPDLSIAANVVPGVGAGAVVAALYAQGSGVNLLEGLPPLATLGGYYSIQQQGYTGGFNFFGAQNWFAANGIDIAALTGGTIVFADGTTGKINQASNGQASLNEPAYIYYQAYQAGTARIEERSGTTGSSLLDTASVSLSFTDADLNGSHSVDSILLSSVWSGGSSIPPETAAALASALTLAREGGSITAGVALADRFVDFLAAGETLTVTYEVAVTDQYGGSASKPVSFIFTGSNDAPSLTAGTPDLGITANLRPGAAAGATIAALYAPGSTINLLDGLPPLTTLGGYATAGYNFVGARNWFAANGIDIAALAGGTIVFADGTTGKIGRASNGSVNNPAETAYIYYQAYSPGQAALAERGGASGSNELDTASVSLDLFDKDLHDTHGFASSLVSSAWSGGSAIPTETAAALAGALSLARNGGSIAANFAIADRLVDFLGAGETLTVTYNVVVTDQSGASASTPVSFTIAGSNDAPVLTADRPDLGIATNVKPGVSAGATIAALYAPGSTVNLLDGLPPLTTLTNYATAGYNFVGGRDWFAANGINIAALAGGTVVFADGTTGLIGRASNGSVNNPAESAYIYYQAYEAGSAWLKERAGISGSSETDTASVALSFTDRDLRDTHSLGFSLTSSVWSGGSNIPAETASALANALSLTQNGGSIAANFALADRLVDFLAEGETLTITYNVSVTDQSGASSSKPVTFTFTGASEGAPTSGLVATQTAKDAPDSASIATGPQTKATAAPDANGSLEIPAGAPRGSAAQAEIDRLYLAAIQDMASFGVAPGPNGNPLAQPEPMKPIDFFA